MVERTESQSWTEFQGEVVDIQFEQPTDEDRLPQWHIQMKPIDKEVKGKTGNIHTWIRIPATATETSLPRGSVADRFCESLEDIHGNAVKNLKTVKEVFMFMKGKKYQFKSKILGRAFEGKNPAEYWVPVKEL